MAFSHCIVCCVLSISIALPAGPMAYAAQKSKVPSNKSAPKAPSGRDGTSSATKPRDDARPSAAQPTKATATSASALSKSIDLTYVSSDAFAVAVIHPRAFFEAPEMELFPREIVTAAVMKETGIDPAKIERVIISFGDVGPQKEPSFAAAAYLSEPLSDRSIEQLKGRAEQASINGNTYWNDLPMRVAFHLPNNRTVVFAPEPALKKILSAKPTDTSLTRRLKQTDFSAHLVAVVSVDAVRKRIDAWMDQAPALPPQFQPLAKIPDLTSAVEVRTQIGSPRGFVWIFHARDDQAAVQLEKLINQLMAISKESIVAEVSQIFRGDDPVEQAAGMYIRRLADHIVGLIKPTRTGSRVSISLGTEGSWTATGILVALLLPAVQKAREAARRASANNNMKRIGLAMHDYLSARKTFPPRAILDKQGKPLLSWRVELLPYLQNESLYKEFRLDEPWDSEHNKQLLARTPAVYQSINVPDVEKTNYLVPIGADTIFAGDKAARIHDIKDGTSKTILLLEVDFDRAVPWTKPDDYEVDPKQPLAGLGNLIPRGKFSAIFADGSVHLLSRDIDPEMFLRLLNKADGQAVRIPGEKNGGGFDQ